MKYQFTRLFTAALFLGAATAALAATPETTPQANAQPACSEENACSAETGCTIMAKNTGAGPQTAVSGGSGVIIGSVSDGSCAPQCVSVTLSADDATAMETVTGMLQNMQIPFGEELEKRLAKAKLLETQKDGTKVYQEADGTKIYKGEHSIAITSSSTTCGSVQFGTQPDGAAMVRLGSIIAAAGENGQITLSDEHSAPNAAELLQQAEEMETQAKLMQKQAEELKAMAAKMEAAEKKAPAAETPAPKAKK